VLAALLCALLEERHRPPRKRDDDCLQELRWLYDRRQLKEVKADIKVWIENWQGRYRKLVAWVEENIEEKLTCYRLPLAHHRNMKSTNMLERFNEEIRRRTRVVRIFPNETSWPTARPGLRR
jgi:putative transposase